MGSTRSFEEDEVSATRDAELPEPEQTKDSSTLMRMVDDLAIPSTNQVRILHAICLMAILVVALVYFSFMSPTIRDGMNQMIEPATSLTMLRGVVVTMNPMTHRLMLEALQTVARPQSDDEVIALDIGHAGYPGPASMGSTWDTKCYLSWPLGDHRDQAACDRTLAG